MKPDLLTDKTAFDAARVGDRVVWFYKNQPNTISPGVVSQTGNDTLSIMWERDGAGHYGFDIHCSREWGIYNLSNQAFFDEWADELIVEV